MTKTNDKSIILDKYNVTKSDFLGSGMEAEVYAYDNNKILKLYNGMFDTNKQNILKFFYSNLNSSSLSYELPYIYDTFVENDILVTIEKRIAGSNLQSVFSEMNYNEQNEMMERYLNVNIELKSVKIEYNLEGFTLFYDNQFTLLNINDSFNLLKEIIFRKKNERNPYFKKDVKIGRASCRERE